MGYPDTQHGTLALYYEPRPGCHVQDAFNEAWIVAVKTKLPVRVNFNDTVVTVTEHLSGADAYLLWTSKRDQRTTKKEV